MILDSYNYEVYSYNDKPPFILEYSTITLFYLLIEDVYKHRLWQVSDFSTELFWWQFCTLNFYVILVQPDNDSVPKCRNM